MTLSVNVEGPVPVGEPLMVMTAAAVVLLTLKTDRPGVAMSPESRLMLPRGMVPGASAFLGERDRRRYRSRPASHAAGVRGQRSQRAGRGDLLRLRQAGGVAEGEVGAGSVDRRDRVAGAGARMPGALVVYVTVIEVVPL